MVITKSQCSVLFMTLIAFAVVARTGPLVDMLLLIASGVFGLSVLLGTSLPNRVRWCLLAFCVLFSLYLILTLVQPSRIGVVNVVGIVVSATVFLYFVQKGPRLVSAPNTAPILLFSGFAVWFVGQALDMVSKNAMSGIAAYFFLAAGAIWVMRGVPLRTVSLVIFALLCALGFVVGHRLMLGAAFVFLTVIIIVYAVPLRAVRFVLLLGVGGGIFGMIVLYSGLWGFDIAIFDAFFIEYTGRTARSGRQIIWPLILAYAAESPWVGRGTGVIFSDLYETNWSAHSYFLQTYLQTGLLGLGSFIFLLLMVWGSIGRPMRSQPITVYMTASFVVLLAHISFEVFLMQVNLLMGCCAWMMLGIGIGCIRASGETQGTVGRPVPARYQSTGISGV